MERKFLAELKNEAGEALLSKDQIDSIMAEHGKAVTTLKNDLTTEQGKVKALEDEKTKIADAMKAYEGIDLADVEKTKTELAKIKSSIETIKKDANTEREKAIKELNAKHAFENALDEKLRTAKSKSIKAVKAMLDMEKIKMDGSVMLGIDDQLKSLGESDPYLFGEKTASSTGGTNPPGASETTKQAAPDFVSAVWGGAKPSEEK